MLGSRSFKVIGVLEMGEPRCQGPQPLSYKGPPVGGMLALGRAGVELCSQSLNRDGDELTLLVKLL